MYLLLNYCIYTVPSCYYFFIKKNLFFLYKNTFCVYIIILGNIKGGHLEKHCKKKVISYSSDLLRLVIHSTWTQPRFKDACGKIRVIIEFDGNTIFFLYIYYNDIRAHLEYARVCFLFITVNV